MLHTSRVLGIDPTPEVLKVARAHAAQDPSLGLPRTGPISGGKLEYRNTAIEDLAPPATPSDGFDIVTLFEVIEHVTTPAAFLAHIYPHVKPGGWLIISTIARTPVSWFTTKFMAEYVLGIVPRGTHDWNKYINEDELRGHLVGKGWESPRALGVVYVPGVGWKEVPGSERVGNYFLGVRKPLVGL